MWVWPESEEGQERLTLQVQRYAHPRVASPGLASQSFATGGLPSRPHFLVLLPHPHASPPPTPWASSSTAHCSPLHTATCPVLNQQHTSVFLSCDACSSFAVSGF